MDCLFCQIINGKKPADIIYQNKKTVAFRDINPKASFHILIVPKKHIISVKEVSEGDRKILGELFLAARKIAEENNLESYKLVVNVGRDVGQTVDHLHIHLLSSDYKELP